MASFDSSSVDYHYCLEEGGSSKLGLSSPGSLPSSESLSNTDIDSICDCGGDTDVRLELSLLILCMISLKLSYESQSCGFSRGVCLKLEAVIASLAIIVSWPAILYE